MVEIYIHFLADPKNCMSIDLRGAQVNNILYGWDSSLGKCQLWANCFMGLLPDTWNCRLRMHRQCRERFPSYRFQRKSLVSIHHGTCVTHVPWCMSGSPTRDGGEKRSRHSRRMRNPQFNLSGKRPVVWSVGLKPWPKLKKHFSPLTAVASVIYDHLALTYPSKWIGTSRNVLYAGHKCN